MHYAGIPILLNILAIFRKKQADLGLLGVALDDQNELFF
jgi:hypothetical protein